MQLHKSGKSQNEILKTCRFQKIESLYPQLADIKDKNWVKIIENARLLKTAPNTALSSQNTDCQNFMLFLEGTIRIYQTADDGREITLYRVQAGELCLLNLNNLLKNKSFNAAAKTETYVETLVINSLDFKSMMNDVGPFRDYVISFLTDRLYETTYLIQETAFNQLNIRLACLLGRLFARHQESVLKITHQNLAFELGTTREVISRILKEFEKQNCIKLSRGSIELTSAEGLHYFSQPE
ncbi:MAG: hypothetical protein DIZ80_03525 [endosymbiont of Galathealinum brachiosum]|uniref:HTH crp-type domain-containing protein n=1 Tax=endosymbiont of Galathealinum brachiosum TaxID=2200906 RepID=A0A370DJ16_9GAMM|nr:MAG: hypothetical protein DIZ80_03525 [endosymbiont of Galathealinum brachiosum]